MSKFMCKECLDDFPCFHYGIIKPLICPFLGIQAKFLEVEETDEDRVNSRLSEMIKENDERPAATPEQMQTDCRDPKARYYDAGGLEVMDVIKAKLTQEQFKGWLLGNLIKYSCRANHKGQFSRDIEKVKFYSAELFNNLE